VSRVFGKRWVTPRQVLKDHELSDQENDEMALFKHFLCLLLAGLILLLTGTPAAILAAGQEGVATTNIYLPIVMNPAAAGPADVLINGGKVESPDGVGVGALASTLDAPLQVSISVTTPPASAVPAPAQVLSGFYQIGAEEDVLVLPENPFILAFPVPAGANTTNLALAVFQSGEGINDVEAGVDDWTFLEGMVDPGQNLFLTTIAGVRKDGEIFTLVEHPDFESPRNDGVGGPSRVNGSQSPEFDLFTVRCVGLSGVACSDATKATVAGYLTDIYNHIHQDLGFNEPRLRYMNETLDYDPHSFSALGYSAYLERSTSRKCIGNLGYYEPGLGRLVLCVNAAVGLTPDSLLTLIHEYFHATQYAYSQVLTDYENGIQKAWVIEGMAASSEESYFVDEMLRTDDYGGLHEVDVSLEYTGGHADLDEYRAQDFWVYGGQRNGLGLNYLESVLEFGASSQAVLDALGNGDVLDLYWDWAKNHVMEPEIDYGGLLGTPCVLETQVVALMEHFEYDFGSNNHYDFALEPLTSLVIKINFDQPYQAATGDVALGDGESPEAELALRYKFYRTADYQCETIPDGRRTYQTVDEREFNYYLVVSNIDPYYAHTYRVVIIDPVPYSLLSP
jgi:hypothetical protein